jgi:hypothetical protein
VSSSWIGQAERAAWQRRAAAELAAILDAHDDLPLITWTVGPAGSVLVGRVSGLFPAARAREVFTAWQKRLVLGEAREDRMSGGTTALHATAGSRKEVTVRLTATVHDDEDGDL